MILFVDRFVNNNLLLMVELKQKYVAPPKILIAFLFRFDNIILILGIRLVFY